MTQRQFTLTLLLVLSSFVWAVSLMHAAPPPQAITCAEDYTVQSGDWLSTIAEKYYGTPLAYTVIANATNLAAQTESRYTIITNPEQIEVGDLLCIPTKEEVKTLIQEVIAARIASAPQISLDTMLILAGNRSFEDIPTTLTISGGEFGEGEPFIINAGEELPLAIPPGEYQATWSLVEGEVTRDFTARPGTVIILYIIPEENLVSGESRYVILPEIGMDDTAIGRADTPSVRSEKVAYNAPEGKGLIVVGNRSREEIFAMLTISGGKFGEGKEVILNPHQEIFAVVEPGSYQTTWSAPNGFSISREFEVPADDVAFVWVVPEEQRGFLQYPGQPGQELK